MAPAKKQKAKGAPPVSAKRTLSKPEQRRINKQLKKAANAANYRAGRAALKKNHLSDLGGVDEVKATYEFTPLQLATFEMEVVKGTPVDDLANGEITDADGAVLDKFPSQYQLWRAIASESSPLAKAYARAKDIAVARLEERIVQVASNVAPGITTTKGQRVTKDGDVVDIEETREADMLGHRSLLIDTLKWQLAHIRPRKHGRQAEPGTGERNEQLESLFRSLNLETEE